MVEALFGLIFYYFCGFGNLGVLAIINFVTILRTLENKECSLILEYMYIQSTLLVTVQILYMLSYFVSTYFSCTERDELMFLTSVKFLFLIIFPISLIYECSYIILLTDICNYYILIMNYTFQHYKVFFQCFLQYFST